MESKLSPIKNKKGQQVGTLVFSIISLVLAAAVLTLGLVISQELRDTQTSGTEAYDAANETLVGLGTFGDFWEIIVLAVVIGVVLSILLGVLAFRGRGR